MITPPQCVKPPHKCAHSAICTRTEAADFYRPPPPIYSSPPLSSKRVRSLRIFFLEGHVGPMNDMFSFFHDGLGLGTDLVDAQIFMQAMINQRHIDPRFMRCHFCRLSRPTLTAMSRWLLSDNGTYRAITLPKCEHKRCRIAAFDDRVRRDFARRFGNALESNYDAVACNFPTWQCALFLYVNVTIIMRFTHRYDHHMQGLPLSSTEGLISNFQNTSIPRTAGEELIAVLRHLASLKRVVFAVSNPYDYIYIRRNIGISAVPWPGLSVQLARIEYTGAGPNARSEVLFCCGTKPYNKLLDFWARRIVNESKRMNVARNSSLSHRRFAWLSELYPKSFQCVSDKNRTTKKNDRVPVHCGYRYEDVAAHQMVVLLPYSVHSYGLVNAYAMGVPIVAPSLQLLSRMHHNTGVVSHKSPSNLPWRSTRKKPLTTFLSRNGRAWNIAEPSGKYSPCCANDPNDACTVTR